MNDKLLNFVTWTARNMRHEKDGLDQEYNDLYVERLVRWRMASQEERRYWFFMGYDPEDTELPLDLSLPHEYQ